MKVGVYGGTFNPIHNGHIDLVKKVLESKMVDEVWLLPSPMNPFKSEEKDIEKNYLKRVYMCTQATSGIPGLVVCTIEGKLPTPSYTITSLNALRDTHTENQFTLIVGADNWLAFDKWHEGDKIIEEYGVIVCTRGGFSVDSSTLPKNVRLLDIGNSTISSTEIRNRVRDGLDISDLVDKKVLECIRKNKLYKSEDMKGKEIEGRFKNSYSFENDKYIFKDGSKIFFTSDTHFGHQHIIEFCNRPFKTAEEMDEALIKNWNSKVPNDGLVFHLGDFAWGDFKYWKSIRERLNGTIILIKGNHDIKNGPKSESQYQELFAKAVMKMHIEIEKRKMFINHEPLLCYGGTYRKFDNVVYNLFGHVHSGPYVKGKDCDRLQYLFPCQYDVGVDNNNYTPISWNDVNKIITERYAEELAEK